MSRLLNSIRDVAICFHVHCLRPICFRSDLTRSKAGTKNLWQSGIKFPLEKLCQLIETKKWSDKESEEIWIQHYPGSPYQLWESDPDLKDVPLTLESIGEKPKFSLDLIPASLRQREFTTRIMNECDGISSAPELQKAIRRYYQFLLLMKRKSKITGKHVPLVPTLDIDLAWHTHQLFPQAYHRYCVEHVGRQIDHDDSLEKNVIVSGLRSTSLAWLKAYNEPYTTKDLKKAYFTRSRVAIGILFPPYGIVLLRVGQKLRKARLGNRQWFSC